MNNVTLVGRLIKDPELRYVGEKNRAVTNFVLAVDREYKNSQGERQADFINIEVWGKQAEILCEYMTKGRMIGIEGKIKVDKYKNENGENRYITRVIANSFRFLDYKNKNVDCLAVKEVEEDYYDSKSLFNEVNLNDEISIEKLPF
ncbi:single-stranded DNA-binding protein [Romboutsia sp. 13368]|uniref:single-stranded DNA-binding protein n=1 Tax=Romboutsia sp. 13368 TaxID=2708053 RepID=UPI0025ED3082|nr:single-stranded DNA-binding protein [Romboutsia sp. 13368]